MGEGTGEARRTESSERDPSFPIVGVGGSAGALSAFQELFSLLPVDSGSAFIVISHGDPQGPTLLPDILRRCTEMPVQEATDGLRIEAGKVGLQGSFIRSDLQTERRQEVFDIGVFGQQLPH